MHEGTTASRAATAPAPVPMTPDGLARLKAELALLETAERPALARRAARARLFLDPGRAAGEARAAEHDLAALDRRIADLKALVAAVEAPPERPTPGVVQLGSAVTVRLDDGAEETWRIVGPLEADAISGDVASTSPAGAALLGKRAGEQVTVGEGALTLTVIALTQAALDEPVASGLSPTADRL